MSVSPNAGEPAQASNLVNVPRLITAYFADRPGSGGSRTARLIRDVRASRIVV